MERLHRRTAEPKGAYFPLPLDKEILDQLLLHCLPPGQQVRYFPRHTWLDHLYIVELEVSVVKALDSWSKIVEEL